MQIEPLNPVDIFEDLHRFGKNIMKIKTNTIDNKRWKMKIRNSFWQLVAMFITAVLPIVHSEDVGKNDVRSSENFKVVDGVLYPYNKGFTLESDWTLTSISITGSGTIAMACTATYTCTAKGSEKIDNHTFPSTKTVTPTWTVTPRLYASVDEAGVVTNQNRTRMDQAVTLTASFTHRGTTKTASKNITLAGLSPVSQYQPLAFGWNWVSFNILPESHKVGDVLGTTAFATNDIILTNDGMARFNGTGWLPSNFTVEYGKMYQIYKTGATPVELSGYASDLWYVPLSAGWNWIANPTKKSVAPGELVHCGGWTAGDRIQSAKGIVTYTGSKWLPAEGFMIEPGNGYQIYTANTGALEFPADGEDERLYAVVDLSGGPDALSYPVRYTNKAPDLDDDTCRTTELWLRKISVGTFMMGQAENEAPNAVENRQEVTLTDDFYIGVFECTQKQWELVMGSNPSAFKGDCRPVESVSYDMIRGAGEQAGAGWPTYGHNVDISSFMGKLQGKTGLVFDLPTEAQWEYACRAGTSTALNSGKNLISVDQDTAMDEVGRYYCNKSDGKGGYSEHTKVGSYLRNAWGLYDMHGNVGEWCLDWWGGSVPSTATNPVGPTTGREHVYRGGSMAFTSTGNAIACRSVSRSIINNSSFNGRTSIIGFRIVYLP